MKSKDALFDMKMKEKFKKESSKMPQNIEEEFENTLTFIKNQEDETMKVFGKKKRSSMVAVAIVCVLCVSTMIIQTTFAQEVVNKIVRSLSLNNITILENKDFKWEDKEIPEAAKGKVFDKDGHVIEKITSENKDEMYNANGEKVFDVDTDGTLITEAVQKENAERNAKENPIDNLIIKDPKKLNGYTCFDVKLPSYLPEGFEFDYAEFYKDDNGEILNDACGVYFINHKTEETIPIFQTYICEELAGETAFNNIKKVKVNGKDAIIGDEGIVWEANGVSYLMYTYDFGKELSIKIAESIR
ncbi:DUF4367 domain-containing protein [Clostridium formicaceticum]|uniref:DUF4367 domain-containing protein n=1 Tax=Clostridium formicaceticum TaxID=1497 RepID=A0AAC9RJK9_9CLOT|nr:DUF4367 domain-containing protein [Clostridium formicaceticum]AOY77709.1 hypothetical protein BJL90_18695 [Clostridium formicaceticum]ARE88296.1 hypothetical protein CLFO_26970 [Clostridium formicaceticum]